MANWASIAYVIEGPKDTLDKIWEAIQNPSTYLENSSKGWEGNILLSLGITWEESYVVKEKTDDAKIVLSLKGHYLRGFIEQNSCYRDAKGFLHLFAEEAWGLTDFAKLLVPKFPDIKIYWTVQEDDGEVYCTNDKEGKYFPERVYVDVCYNGDYYSEYFLDEESALKWLSKITKNKICTKEDIEKFNEDMKDSDDFIYVHYYAVED